MDKKLAKMQETVKKRLKMIADSDEFEEEQDEEEEDEMGEKYTSEIISQLKEKFQKCSKKVKRYKFFQFCPKVGASEKLNKNLKPQTTW